MRSFWNNLSDREKKLITILSLIVALYLIYNLLVVKSMERLEEVRAELSQVEEREKKLEIGLTRIKRLDEEYGDHSLSQALARLPEEVQIPQTILWLEELFSDPSLSQPDIQFNQAEDGINSNYMQLSLSFTGSYNSIYNLVRKIESNERVVSIESLNISGSGEDMSANMLVNFYQQSKAED